MIVGHHTWHLHCHSNEMLHSSEPKSLALLTWRLSVQQQADIHIDILHLAYGHIEKASAHNVSGSGQASSFVRLV